jgi:DNA-binding FadR family transcriptional regulator
MITPIVDPTTGGMPAALARRRSGRKMSHLIAAELRRRIVRGEIAPGDTLPNEAELVKVLDISRDTLREALRMLESESLISIRRGRHGGAVVRRPDLRAIARYVGLLLQIQQVTMDDIHEARIIIEGPAIALLADHLSPALEDKLAALHSSQADVSDVLALLTGLKKFDQGVVDLAGNKMISLLSGIYRDVYAGELYTRLSGSTRSRSEVLRRLDLRQTAFLSSVSNGDRDDIQQSWLDYLEETRQLIVGARKRAGPINVTTFWRAEVDSNRANPANVRTDKMAAAIAVEIRARVAEGVLQSGDKLPSLPELAASFGVSRPTLREALRILERESLLDLRTGTQGGAQIRIPSTEIAGQLAAIILEIEQTTIGDVWEARMLIEPALIGMAAERIDKSTLDGLRVVSERLEAAISDTPLFTRTWREGEMTILRAAGNPVTNIAMEIAYLIQAACQNQLTADAVNLPWVERSNRRAKRRFDDTLVAAIRSDNEAARAAWTDFVRGATPFFQALGDRLILDMLD